MEYSKSMIDVTGDNLCQPHMDSLGYDKLHPHYIRATISQIDVHIEGTSLLSSHVNLLSTS